MKKLQVKIELGQVTRNVGELYLSEKMGRLVFAYDDSFIGTGLELSPFTMPLSRDSYTAERNSDFYDLHGLFADCLPDEWGRRVQDVEFEKLGKYDVTAIDRLAFIGRHGIGALCFEPSQEFERGNEIVDLSRIRKAVQQVIEGDVENVSGKLLHCGGSAGGARPKFLIDLNLNNLREIRYTRGYPEGEMLPAIIKVPVRKQDHFQRIEYCYSKMAREGGISIPDTYLIIGQKSSLAHFAVKRFDVTKSGERFHTHTLAGVQGINFRTDELDYEQVLRTTAELTRNHCDVTEMYRRMVFNYLGCNKDDHAKNFSFLMDKTGIWSLSPAYDIGYSPGANNRHAISCNGKKQNITVRDLEKIAESFDIVKWKEIIEQVCHGLSLWKSYSRNFHVPEKHMKKIYERIGENMRRVIKDLHT